jgi:hypothetical protein
MLSDRSNTTILDGARVNVNEPCELAEWTEKLGCNADQIRSAVEKVGTLAKDVLKELKK